jgi:hypothetical protein
MAEDKPVVVDAAPVTVHEEPPVVARLVVEIRSDGTRTIARGALMDATLGQEVAVQAEGTTPLALAASLVRAMIKAPFLPWGRAFGGALRALKGRSR